MKKLILVSVAVLSLTLFAACNSSKVASMVFYSNDGSVPPPSYSEAELKVIPDYAEKTLNVEYFRTFPDRTAETDEADLQTSGILGDEYFTRFEDLVEVVENYQAPETVNEDDYVGAGVFSVNLSDLGGKEYKIKSFWNVKAEEFQALQSFYMDIVNILTQEVPV